MAEQRRKAAREGSDTALLLIDFIHPLDYEHGEALLPHALRAAQAASALKRRANKAGIRVIYVNDNFGEWRSDFKQVVERCLRKRCLGRPLARLLRPGKSDYFVLKPKNSGFYQTPLRSLLQNLNVKRLLLSGLTADICVLFTANDAHLHEFEIWVVSDCVASPDLRDTQYALQYLKRVVNAKIVPSQSIVLQNGEAKIAPGRAEDKLTAILLES
jgi:nicotinamidase-related amidase